MKNKAKTILVAAAFAAMATTFTACEDTFTDPRDGQKYKTMKIGEQVWLAENLRYKGGADSLDIGKAGNGYEWDSALVACPEGWHLPSKAELESAANSAEFVLERPLWSSTYTEYVEDFVEKIDVYALGFDKQMSVVDSDMPLDIRCVQGRETIDGYEVVRVGGQIWMRDNINVETPTSVCYLDDKDNCSLGRYYSVGEVKKHLCPENFRYPGRVDVEKLDKDAVYRLFKPMGVYNLNKKSFEDSQNVYVLGIDFRGFYVFRSFKGVLKFDRYYDSYIQNYKFPVRCIYDPIIPEIPEEDTVITIKL